MIPVAHGTRLQIERATGWWPFLMWGLVGIVSAFPVAMFPIGLLAIPGAACLISRASQRLRTLPESLGLGLGPSSVMLFVAFMHWGTPVCGQGRVVVDHDIPFECGGINALAWLWGGILVASFSVLSFSLISYFRK